MYFKQEYSSCKQIMVPSGSPDWQVYSPGIRRAIREHLDMWTCVFSSQSAANPNDIGMARKILRVGVLGADQTSSALL